MRASRKRSSIGFSSTSSAPASRSASRASVASRRVVTTIGTEAVEGCARSLRQSATALIAGAAGLGTRLASEPKLGRGAALAAAQGGTEGATGGVGAAIAAGRAGVPVACAPRGLAELGREQDEAGRLRAGELEAFGGVGRLDHVVAGGRQLDLHHDAVRRYVFDHEDSPGHGSLHHWGRARRGCGSGPGRWRGKWLRNPLTKLEGP